MRMKLIAGLTLLLTVLFAACGKPPATSEEPPSSRSGEPAAAQASVAAPNGPQAPGSAGPAPKPGGGLLAEPSGVEGVLAISIRWSAKIVVGVPAEGLTTTVYKRAAQLVCPVTSGDEAATSYFAVFDNPNGDPTAATGSYQPWWNEDCTGSLTIDDTYHADDPTLAGPEPVVRTTGTRPLSTPDTPLTVETDLNRARTRYMFVTPSTDGFQQEAAPGYEAKLVKASAAPMATMDFTLEGPIGDGKREVPVSGGILQVEWTFSRGRTKL
ncbi:hypothetical protein EG835_08250 [bacterium]|nr:hypothetical protein [bacterium]